MGRGQWEKRLARAERGFAMRIASLMASIITLVGGVATGLTLLARWAPGPLGSLADADPLLFWFVASVVGFVFSIRMIRRFENADAREAAAARDAESPAPQMTTPATPVDRAPAVQGEPAKLTNLARVPPRRAQPASGESGKQELARLLRDELVEGEELLARMPGHMTGLAIYPRTVTTKAEVDDWEDRVSSLLAPFPRKQARFERPTDDTRLLRGLSRWFGAVPLGHRLNWKMDRVEKIVQELDRA